MRETIPHHMPLSETHGNSPGNGISAPLISAAPMAFEEEFFADMERSRRMTERSMPEQDTEFDPAIDRVERFQDKSTDNLGFLDI